MKLIFEAHADYQFQLNCSFVVNPHKTHPQRVFRKEQHMLFRRFQRFSCHQTQYPFGPTYAAASRSTPASVP
jgi:hypothetical protein